jgi:hypothetical protein
MQGQEGRNDVAGHYLTPVSHQSPPPLSFAIHDQSGPGMISRLPRDLLAKPFQVFTPYDGEIFDEPDAYFEFQLHVPAEGGAEPPQGEVDY